MFQQQTRIVFNYTRFDNESSIDFSFNEFLDLINNIKDWSNIRLEKEVFKPVILYDQYATRVIVDDLPIGYISKVDSPIVSFLRDLQFQGLINLRLNIAKNYEYSIIKELVLLIEFVSEDIEINKILNQLNLLNVEVNN